MLSSSKTPPPHRKGNGAGKSPRATGGCVVLSSSGRRPAAHRPTLVRAGPGVSCVSPCCQGPLGAHCSGPQALVKVERPQRSEDVRHPLCQPLGGKFLFGI